MKKILLTTGIIALFIIMAVIPACTSTETRGTDIIPTREDPKFEKTFFSKYLHLLRLKDPVFTFEMKTKKSIYEKDELGHTIIDGIFFNVKITGEIGEVNSEVQLWGYPFALFFGYISHEKLGIEIGDNIEIILPILSTYGPIARRGTINEDGLSITSMAPKATIKVYD